MKDVDSCNMLVVYLHVSPINSGPFNGVNMYFVYSKEYISFTNERKVD